MFRAQSASHVFALATMFTITTIVPIKAQEEAPAPEDPSADAGYFFYQGGTVRAKRARTYTSPTTFSALNVWRRAAGATLTYVVPAGQSDLFNVSFSAECQKLGGGQLRIRIRHTVGIVTNFLEPYDGAQAFCSSATPATYKGNWARRVGAGTHTLAVEFLNTGFGPGIIDDYTFELVVYQ